MQTDVRKERTIPARQNDSLHAQYARAALNRNMWFLANAECSVMIARGILTTSTATTIEHSSPERLQQSTGPDFQRET